MAEHLPDPPENPDLPAKKIMTWVALLIGVVALVWAGYLQVQNHVKAETAQQSATAGQTLADQVKAACAKGGEVARQLGAACQQAADVKANPPAQPGATGSQGVPGEQGPQGVQGIAGTQGLQGQPGTTGPVGDTGQPGSTGESGTQGPKGDTGEPGPGGPAGQPGEQGSKGDQGEAAPRITNVSMDMSSCTGTVTLSDGTSFPIAMSGCTPALIGGE